MTSFLWQNICQNHFGHPNCLKNHVRGCICVKYQSFAASGMIFQTIWINKVILTKKFSGKSWSSWTILILSMLKDYVHFHYFFRISTNWWLATPSCIQDRKIIYRFFDRASGICCILSYESVTHWEISLMTNEMLTNCLLAFNLLCLIMWSCETISWNNGLLWPVPYCMLIKLEN